jgi:hypothetical protein
MNWYLRGQCCKFSFGIYRLSLLFLPTMKPTSPDWINCSEVPILFIIVSGELKLLLALNYFLLVLFFTILSIFSAFLHRNHELDVTVMDPILLP